MNEVICGDSATVMRSLDADSIDLTVTSPPYDSLRAYNGYSFDFESIATEMYRVTKKGGVVVWVVGDSTKNGSESGTSFRQALYFKEVGFNLHDTMIYAKQNPIPSSSHHGRYEQQFEYMFVFSKGKTKTFNAIMEPCAHAGLAVNRMTNRAVQESSMCKKDEITITKDTRPKRNIWYYIVGGRSTATDIIHHTAAFPEKLAEDHILSWSNEGDVVFDPFAGSGTTLKMAKLHRRRYLGIEISREYCDGIEVRLENAKLPEEEPDGLMEFFK